MTTPPVTNSKCPRCQYVLNEFRQFACDDKAKPKPNDQCVCTGCGLPLVFDESLTLRRSTAADIAQLKKKQPRLWQLSLALGARYN